MTMFILGTCGDFSRGGLRIFQEEREGGGGRGVRGVSGTLGLQNQWVSSQIVEIKELIPN